MAWVYSHPTLSDRDDSDYPEPPSQGAENLLATIQLCVKTKMDFFKQVQSHLLKMQESAVTTEESVIEQQELRAIEELWGLTAQLLGQE